MKNQTLNKTRKHMYLSEVKGKLKNNFSMNQLKQLEEVKPNRMSKNNKDIKDKYQFELFDRLCSKRLGEN